MNNNKENIQHGLTGDNLEKELAKAEQETNSNPKVNKSEEIDSALESQLGTLETDAEKVENMVAEAGGSEGINQVLSKMSSSEREELNQKIENQKKIIAKKRYAMEYGSGNFDDLWWLFKEMAKGNLFKIEKYDGFLGKAMSATGNIASAPMGALEVVALSPLKGIQTIVRKIKLKMEKNKLSNLEKKAV